MTNKKKQKNILNKWEEKKLGEICKINPKVLELPKEFIYIDLESVVSGKLIKKNKILKSEAPSRAQRVLKNNDILFQMVRPYQKNNLFFKFGDGYVASTGYAQIRAKYSPMYLYQYLNMQGFVNKVLVRCTGSNYPAINSTDLAKIRIVFPPIEEQNRIVGVLECWDGYLEKLGRKIELKKNIKKGLMQQLLTGGKRLDGFSNTWKTLKLENIGEIVTGSTPPKKDLENYGKDFCWATAEDFNSKYIFDTNIKLTEEGRKKSRFLPKGSILVTCIASIGKNAIAGTDLATNQQINSVIVNKENLNEFIYYLMEHSSNLLKKFAGAGAMPILNKVVFSKIKFKVPEIKEQKAIADILTKADDEIEALVKKKEIIGAQKKYLLNNLVTGKILTPKNI